jgi:hypothetical protein
MKLMRVPDAVRLAQRKMALAGETDRLYQVYRCYSCRNFVTKIDILEARARGSAAVCPCGSVKIQPTNTTFWQEISSIKMLKMVWAVHTKQLAPPPEPPTSEEQKEADRVAHEAMRAFERQALEIASRLP